jgi:hypothetical protein
MITQDQKSLIIDKLNAKVLVFTSLFLAIILFLLMSSSVLLVNGEIPAAKNGLIKIENASLLGKDRSFIKDVYMDVNQKED